MHCRIFCHRDCRTFTELTVGRTEARCNGHPTSDCLKGTGACLLVQVALVCHQEVQRVLKLEKGVEVVVAEQDGQLAGLQTLQHSRETRRRHAPEYSQTTHTYAQLHDHEMQQSCTVYADTISRCRVGVERLKVLCVTFVGRENFKGQ